MPATSRLPFIAAVRIDQEASLQWQVVYVTTSAEFTLNTRLTWLFGKKIQYINDHFMPQCERYFRLHNNCELTFICRSYYASLQLYELINISSQVQLYTLISINCLSKPKSFLIETPSQLFLIECMHRSLGPKCISNN